MNIMNGTIIGSVTYQAELVSPAGTVYREIVDTYQDGVEWAERTRAEQLAMLPPSMRPRFDVPWTLKVWC